MAANDNISTLKILADESTMTDEIATVYLTLAADKVMKRLYPNGNEADEMPPEYNNLMVELAARLYLRRGAEGESAHNENGISRTYGSSCDDDILSQIVPFVKVG